MLPSDGSDRTVTLSPQQKLGEAFDGAMPLVGPDARTILVQMVQPASLVIMAVTLVAWAASHAFGVGELIDAILLVIGAFTIGMSALEAARDIHDFVVGAMSARNSLDIEDASEHLAKAIALIGVTIVQAVLTHGQAKVAIARGRAPQFRGVVGGMPEMPPPGNKLLLQRPRSLPGGRLGETDPYGRIKLARFKPGSTRDSKTGNIIMQGRQEAVSFEQRRVILYHELFHRYVFPRTGPLRHLRAHVNMTTYQQSALLRYLSEAMAQGYGLFKEYGFIDRKAVFRFPLDGGYMTASQLWHEGRMIGNIMLRGDLYHVSISMGIPTHHEYDDL